MSMHRYLHSRRCSHRLVDGGLEQVIVEINITTQVIACQMFCEFNSLIVQDVWRTTSPPLHDLSSGLWLTSRCKDGQSELGLMPIPQILDEFSSSPPRVQADRSSLRRCSTSSTAACSRAGVFDAPPFASTSPGITCSNKLIVSVACAQPASLQVMTTARRQYWAKALLLPTTDCQMPNNSSGKKSWRCIGSRSRIQAH